MRDLETDHVISGPMKGLKINCNGRGQHSIFNVQHSDRHCDYLTNSAQRAKSVKRGVNDGKGFICAPLSLRL